MPITTYLDGAKYHDETKRIMGLAFGLVCTALRAGDSDDYVKRAIAAKVIDLAEAGERNPDVICELLLKDIRRSWDNGLFVPGSKLEEREHVGHGHTFASAQAHRTGVAVACPRHRRDRSCSHTGNRGQPAHRRRCHRAHARSRAVSHSTAAGLWRLRIWLRCFRRIGRHDRTGLPACATFQREQEPGCYVFLERGASVQPPSGCHHSAYQRHAFDLAAVAEPKLH